MTPILRGSGPSSREVLFYYRAYKLMAVRKGPWKMHLITQNAYGPGSREPQEHDPPLLYNLEHDPSEKLDVAASHKEVIKTLRAEIEVHQDSLVAVGSQLEL